MANDVVFRLTGQEADLIRSFQRSNQELRAIVKGLADVETQSRRSKQQTTGLFGDGVRGAKQFIGAITGIGSVLGGITAITAQIRREFETLQQFQKTAADTQLGRARAERGALENLGVNADITFPEVQRRVAGISRRTGVTQTPLFEAAGAVFSARGGLTASQALEAVEAAAELTPTEPEALSTIAGTALDLKKKQPDADVRQILGFFAQAKGAARIETTEAFAQFGARAINQIQEFGDTPEQAAELFAALTQGIGDQTGRLSGTASVNLAKQLALLVPERSSTTERIEFLQSEAGRERREKFAGSAGQVEGKPEISISAQAFTTATGLVTPGSTAAGLLGAAQRNIGSLAGGGDVFAQQIAQQNQLDSIRLLRLQQTFGTASEALLGGQVGAAQGSISREGLRQLLQATGTSNIDQRIESAFFEAFTEGGQRAPLEAVASSLEGRARRLETPRSTESTFTQAARVNPVVGPLLDLVKDPSIRQPTEEDRQLAATLREVSEALRNFAAQGQKVDVNVEVSDKRTDVAVKQATAAPPKPPEAQRDSRRSP